jgi:hypothetical protein
MGICCAGRLERDALTGMLFIGNLVAGENHE